MSAPRARGELRLGVLNAGQIPRREEAEAEVEEIARDRTARVNRDGHGFGPWPMLCGGVWAVGGSHGAQ